jgi:hypothetical protein
MAVIPDQVRYDSRVFFPHLEPAEKLCSDRGELSGMTIQAPSHLERAGIDRDMRAIFSMKGLLGRRFWLLFRRREK